MNISSILIHVLMKALAEKYALNLNESITL